MKLRLLGILSLLMGFANTCFAQQSFFVWKDGKQTVRIADSITFDKSKPESICLWLDNEQTFVTADSISQRQPNMNISFNTNGYEYVDLGLPSGMYWATANVGATSPTENGKNFRWAGVTPNYSTYDRSYPYENSTENEPYKYNINKNGVFYDGLEELDLYDDAANSVMGGSWRMPNKSEVQELLDNCTWSVDTIDSIRVYIGVGPNGNKIILPETKQFWANNYYDVLNADYWTKSVGGGSNAVTLAFDSTGKGYFNTFRRDEQIPVRAVCNPNEKLSKTSYSVSVKSNAANAGTIVGAGVYKAGLTVPVKAVAKEGYEFLGFSNEKKMGANTSLWLYHDVELAAVFMTSGECEDGKYNGFGYVDLGLPSGKMWATCNLGASKVEEEGQFFTWGEVAPKEVYSDDVKQPESGSELTDSTDAAHVNMGDFWRTPLSEDWFELLDYTYKIATTINGVDGYRLVSKINGKWIFLPKCYNREGEGKSTKARYEYLFANLSSNTLYYLREYSNNELAFGGSSYLGVGSGTSQYWYGYPLRAVYRKGR